MDKKLSRLRSLGVSYPVIQAGMPGLAGVRLEAAVARAGGIGVLGLQDVSTWEDSLQALKGQAAGKPVGATCCCRALEKNISMLFCAKAFPW